MANFALIGAAGYVAPRHMQAIRDTGNQLVAATDIHDSVGILDRYFPDCRFFTEIERFDRFLEKRRRGAEGERIEYLTVCSPNHLHDAHVRLALRTHAHAVCEKPLVVNPWNLDQLAELEAEYDRRVYTVLQLRVHPALIALRERILADTSGHRYDVVLTYITRRGRWYNVSWKGDEEKSGGLMMNIGIHFFDLLLWLFGDVQRSTVQVRQKTKAAGLLQLDRAQVRWFLSTDHRDLPAAAVKESKPAYRSLTMDGEEIEFSNVFTDLHTTVYQEIMAGRGFGIEDARPSIELVYRIRTSEPTDQLSGAHPAVS